MKRYLYITFLMLLALYGCRHSDIQTEARDDQGIQTSVNLRFIQAEASTESSDNWNEINRSLGLTPTQEQNIKVLDILVFNSSGILVSRQTIPNPVLSSVQSISTKSGTNITIYAIANASAQSAGSTGSYDLLGSVYLLSDLQDLKVQDISTDISINNSLLMQGSVSGVTLVKNPSSNSASILLNYIAAKVRVNIVSTLPSGSSFELVNWQLKSYPIYSYIVPLANDASSAVGDYATTTTLGNTWDNKSDIIVDGSPMSGQTTVFYLYENRKGTISASTTASQKTGLAPANATALVINGLYKTANSVTSVVSTIMLGANSINDYNIARSNQYTYTINIKGLNNITVDTRYTTGNSGFKVDLLQPILDAHYDWRPLRIGSWQGTASIQILDQSGNAVTSSFWLKLSAKDLVHFINDGSGNYIRPTYIPATDLVTSISNISFTNASAMTYSTYYLYADEYLIDGSTRSAQVVISSIQSSFNTPETVTLIISQKGAQTMGAVGLRKINSSNAITTTNYKLAIENYEEYSMNITPDNAANENKTGMQWGFSGTALQSGLSAYTQRSGFDNTSLAVFNAGVLRPPYGQSGGLAGSSFNPIYNNYSARYCFEKNRDLDGNGSITGNEIQWYLPSSDELALIYVGFPSLPQPLSLSPYWTSTEVNTLNTTSLDFTNAATYVSQSKPTLIRVRCVRAI